MSFRSHLSLFVFLLAVALVAAACGDSDSNGGGDETSSKPVITVPEGEPPAELEIVDLVEGDGAEAVGGAQLEMDYVGVAWSDGEEFDSSWDRGNVFGFQLGAGAVIPGWDEGIAGMREGGRRQLTIPPDMAYGAAGFGTAIAPNETLIFVVDLRSVN